MNGNCNNPKRLSTPTAFFLILKKVNQVTPTYNQPHLNVCCITSQTEVVRLMKNLLFSLATLFLLSFNSSSNLNGFWIIKGPIGKHLVFTKAKDASAFNVNLVGLEIKDKDLKIHFLIPGKGKAIETDLPRDRKVDEAWPELEMIKKHPNAEKVSGTYHLTEATSSQLIFDAK